MLENVKGFEISNAHQLFISTLRDCKYRIREFLLSPDQFGIPNSRLRYYLLAKHESGEFQDEENEEVHQDERQQPPSPPRQENDNANNEEGQEEEQYEEDVPP